MRYLGALENISSAGPSDVLALLRDVHNRQYESASVCIHTENIRLVLEREEDPQQELIERGRQLSLHVYASVRMNDNHFNGRPPSLSSEKEAMALCLPK